MHTYIHTYIHTISSKVETSGPESTLTVRLASEGMVIQKSGYKVEGFFKGSYF